MRLCCGEVCGHEVGIGHAGEALDGEEVANLRHQRGACEVCAYGVDLFHGENNTLPRLADLRGPFGIGVVGGKFKHDGFANVMLEHLVVGVNGCLEHLFA